MLDEVSFLPIGGVGDVTKNMYLYTYKDQILIVDCGLGFADETMLGVDLLLPDISYLLQAVEKDHKKIVGMVLTHGHEDHIGALPFILPQLSESFPIYATPLTAALANEKLKEFKVPARIQTVPFDNSTVRIGDFTTNFIRITHSVPDSSNIFIETPAGNFYHASDFKFDLTPIDGKKTEFAKIVDASEKGILCLMSDSLGSERPGYTPSEETILGSFETEMLTCKGRFIVTTYSSNISRLNEAIQAAEKFNRKVCFVGRSLVKAKEVAQKLDYLQIKDGNEVAPEDLKRFPDNKLLLLVAGSQGQENSALTRIANGEHREVTISADDVIVFSADPIPGNETSVNALIDTLSKSGARVVYSEINDEFHVSGHGSSQDLLLMMSLTKPKFLVPISGTYRHMVAYKRLSETFGFQSKNTLLLEDGQEVVFTKDAMRLGQKIDIKNVYVDEISGGELDNFVLRDRKRLSEGGIVIVMSEVDSATGQLDSEIDIIIRGFVVDDPKRLKNRLTLETTSALAKRRKGRVTDWVNMRRFMGNIAERFLFKELRRRPLVLPIVIEV